MWFKVSLRRVMYVKTWTKQGGGVEMQDVVVVVLYVAEGWALMFSGGKVERMGMVRKG
jgi:hypothetical protein